MKIGFDAKRLFNNRGGLASYARTLLLALHQSIPDLIIYLYTTKINSPYDLSIFMDDPRFIIRTYQGPFSWYWRSKGLVKQLVNDGIDIYHGLAAELPTGIHKTNIKTVVTIHDTLWKSHKNDYRLPDRLILNEKLKFALDQADHIVAISEVTNEAISKIPHYDASKVSVINQIAAPEFYQPIKNFNEVSRVYNLPDPYILAVGNVKKRKNIPFLIEAMKYLKDESVRLVIIGKPKEYDIPVTHISGLDYQELPAVYQGAKLCVYPSLNEGFGLPILESILCGSPVCAVDKSPMNQFDSPLLHSYPAEVTARGLAKLIDHILNNDANNTDKIGSQDESSTYAHVYQSLYKSLL